MAALSIPLALSPAYAANTTGDIDGDGYADLFVGAPEGVGGNDARGGYVAVVPGSSDGAQAEEGYQIDQDSEGVSGVPEADDRFGEQVASADLDGDGHADLIVATPAEDVEEHEDAGLVQIVFGSEEGLSEQSVTLHSPRQERGDTGFGSHLAVGDLNGDGYGDVAIANGGYVTVLWGRSDLPDSDSDPRTTSLPTTSSEGHDVSGLALDDVTGSGDVNLLVATEGDDGEGELNAFEDMTNGSEAEPLHQPLSLPDGDVQVAAGDIDGDGHADAVVTPGGGDAARVFAGSPDGLGEEGTILEDGLGTDAVAVGDLDGDGYADIVLGDTTVESPDGGADAGGVNVVYGGPDWTDGRQESFTQGADGVAGQSEPGDRMGAAVTLIDLDGDERPDLVAGVPGENGGNGAITVVYNSEDGLTGEGSQTFGGATMGLDGSRAEFGAALS